MTNVIRKLTFKPENSPAQFLYNEWLVTNGLGGYASTSLSGTTTRKYHGLLIAALPAPVGRMVMLNYVQDRILLSDGNQIPLSCEEFAQKKFVPEIALTHYRLEDGLPIWTYTFNGYIIEKSIFMPYKQNTVHITYHFLQGQEKINLSFQPFYQFRHHESSVTKQKPGNVEYIVSAGNQFEIQLSGLPSLKIFPSQDVKFLPENETLKNIQYRIEAERGYDSVGDLKSPGSFTADLEPQQTITFIASTESWDNIKALPSQELLKAEKERRHHLILGSKKYFSDIENDPLIAELIYAADQFIITPIARTRDIAWTHSVGEEARTIIAGYHWFTDWGRDTMISLEGLTLVTGRIQEAGYILRTFAHHLKDGLIPNLFPDGENQGLYHTADATLWFFHALDRYYAYTKDDAMMNILLPNIKKILEYHFNGTHFGIHMDTKDGLLFQGEEGYALTWMDAKVGDLVITPRRGKAVEINALWYNALCLAVEWLNKYDQKSEAASIQKIAEQCCQSFNQKFWFPEGGYLYDVIEGANGNDSSCRPNQLFSISLKYSVLNQKFWESVLGIVKTKLLTRVGLRTLSPDHPDYKISYSGNLFLRDSAYHQGTIWPWLIGPYTDAFLRVFPEKKEDMKKLLKGFNLHMNEGCIGSINEIFDATEPFTHRGCIAQAWSVAEILRAWVKVSKNSSER